MKLSALILVLLAAASIASAQNLVTRGAETPDPLWNTALDPSSQPAPSLIVSEAESTTPATMPSAPAETVSEDFVHESLKKGVWQLGIFGGGGDGLGKSDNTQFMFAGGRFGFVLTGQHLPGWLRGDFEWAGDIMPIYTVFPPNSAVYGGSIRPVIWQWNFTSKKKVAPYFAAVGGIIFTRQDVPPGNTSEVNFSPGASFGANVFTKRRRALLFEMSIIHISNASLGRHNPGYNGSIFFTVGYSWFRGGH